MQFSFIKISDLLSFVNIFLVFSKILNVLFSKKAMSAAQKTIMIIPFGDKNPRRQDNLSTGTFFIKYYKQICRRQRRPCRRRGNGHRHTSIFRKLCFFSGVALFIAICCPFCAPSKKGAAALPTVGLSSKRVLSAQLPLPPPTAVHILRTPTGGRVRLPSA